MSDQERIDAILRKMRTELETHLEEESKITDPIEYEDHLLEIGRRFSLEVLKSSRGKMPKSRNQKKSLDQTRKGRIT